MITLPHNDINIYLLIGKNIKKYRKSLKMTQYELAKKSGYSYAFIRRIESTNSQKYFSLQTVYNISLALNIDIKNLFENNDI